MKVAVISDIHGNIVALKKVLEDIKAEGIRKFILLGDVVLFGPDPAAVMAELKKLDIIAWIKGNTDMFLEEFSPDKEPNHIKQKVQFHFYLYALDKLSSEDLGFLRNLPEQKSLELMGRNILCVHGSPRSVTEVMDHRVPYEELKEMLEGVKESIILCGHSHIPYIGKVEDKYVYNAGSIGRPLDDDIKAAYGILDLSQPSEPQFTVKRIAFSVDEVIAMAKERKLPFLDQYEYSLRYAVSV